MEIQVAQRELGRPIARGNTADLYAWEDGYVLKLFHRFSLEDIEYEARLTRAVHASGLPVPLPREIIQVNGRYGLIYERVDGPSMLEEMLKHPLRLFRYARRMAELHVEMHGKAGPETIPSLRRRLQAKIRRADPLPEQVRASLLEQLAGLPDGDRFLHGDFHPGNILMARQGAVVIDWIDTTCGNPLADLARTSIILLGAAATETLPNPFAKLFVRLFHAVYLRHYLRLRPGGEQEYRRWLPVMAGARLEEGIPEVEQWLIAQARRPV